MIYNIPQDFVGSYDTAKLDFTTWTLDTIQQKWPNVSDLSTIHKVLSVKEIAQVARYVQDKTSKCTKYMSMLDKFFADNVAPLIEHTDYLVQRQPNLRVVIPGQEAHGQRVNFHCDALVGGGRGSMTAWIPLTDAYDSNSLYIADLDPSRDLVSKFIENRWPAKKFDEECYKLSKNKCLSPGEFLLFDQERVHGSINNTTQKTRFSFDARFLIRGHETFQRVPGGYFRLPGDYSQRKQIDKNSNLLVYLNRSTAFTKHIPFGMQRAFIDSYSRKFDLSDASVDFLPQQIHEPLFIDWLPGLENFITKRFDGIIMLSIFALPEDQDRREFLCNFAIENNMKLFFANEELCIETTDDIQTVNEYYKYAVWQDGDFPWE